jgi:SAM-dependent methyltransferase
MTGTKDMQPRRSKQWRRLVERVWPLRPIARSRDRARRERDALRAERDALLAERSRLAPAGGAGEGGDLGAVIGVASPRDREVTGDPGRRRPLLFSHDDTWPWLAGIADSPDVKVLEIGSREVVSASLWKKHFPRAAYTGFDYISGKNVDVVGDAHKLSSYFDESVFDIVISFAVFEHLAMPWIVAEEIAKVLKVGGLVAIETHFSFSEHEMPWHFFQFNSEALKILFNPGLGFEVLDCGLCNPIVGRFSADASPYLVGQPVGALYCHSSIVARKTAHVLGKGSPPFDWASLVDAVQATSSYPEGTGLSQPPGS